LVLREQRRLDVDLLGQIGDSLVRYLGCVLREPPLDAQETSNVGLGVDATSM